MRKPKASTPFHCHVEYLAPPCDGCPRVQYCMRTGKQCRAFNLYSDLRPYTADQIGKFGTGNQWTT